MNDPRITDNDNGEISASVDGKEIRAWSYKDDAERRIKMQMAHEFAEGWFQSAPKITATLKNRIDTRLNDYLCEMKPDYDDSITGFNEAWDIVRDAFVVSIPSAV